MINGCLFPFRQPSEQCPLGHSLARGTPQTIGWTPCICPAAREADEHGRGLGHLWVRCGTCAAEGRDTVLYEPPHDIGGGRAAPW